MDALEQIFGSSSANSLTADKPRNELGQDDFLKLMVTQLQNQDPVNPADNSEFLGQIAQFSMVSGIDDLGVSFDGIASNLYAAQAMEAAQLVGKEVLIESSWATFSGEEPMSGVIDVMEPIDNARLLIRDSAGSLVRSLDLGRLEGGQQRFAWDGETETGEVAAPGVFSVSAEGLAEGALVAVPVLHFSRVESVSVDRANTNVMAHLANGEQVGVSQIREYK